MHSDSLDRLTQPLLYKTAVLMAAMLLGAPCLLFAEELINYKEFQVSTSGQFECGPSAKVQLHAPSEEHFRRSRVERQELANLVRSYLWIDCPEIESIHFQGYAEQNDKSVFQGQVKRSEDWFLNEGEEPKDKPANHTKSPPPPKQPSSKTLEALEATAAKGNEEAMLELARGLIGKAPENSPIKFKQDRPRGVALLEQLVSKGNAEALQLLAQAYLEDAKLPINLPLISRATKMDLSQTAGQREDIAAQMTLSAAANGSKGAIAALNAAGKAGSAEAFLALAQMYTRDKEGKMPYGDGFLKKELGLQKGYSAKQHHKVGLEFFAKASDAGSKQATQLLKELGMKPSQPSQAASNSQAKPPSASAQTPSGQRNLAELLPQLLQRGTVEEILEQRSSAASSSAQTGSGSNQPQTQTTASQSQAASASGSSAQSGQGRGASQAGASPKKNKARGSGQKDRTKLPPSVSKPGSHSRQPEPLIID